MHVSRPHTVFVACRRPLYVCVAHTHVLVALGWRVCRPWELRRVDIDPLGHVNNAAQWAIVEESLPADGSRRGLAELDFAPGTTTLARVDLLLGP